MKWSMFNYKKKVGNQTRIFNTFTRASIIIDKGEDEIDLNAIESELAQQLMESGIIVEDDFDEIALFKYWYNSKVMQNNFLAITYIPTYACNFNCEYCIEGEVSIKGSYVDKKKIFEFLDYYIDKTKFKILDFVFFGGEPLLKIDDLIDTARFLNQKISKINAKIAMSVVTNGYLLNEENANRLVDNGIKTFQITIDGESKKHNIRRKLKNGDGTYDIITKNVKSILDKHGKDVEVVINMNYDEENYLDIIEFIENPPFDLKLVKLKMNPIKNSHQNIKRIGKITHNNSAKIIYDKLKELSLYDEDNFMNEYGPCLARIRNSIIVDCYGNLHKCVFGVGNKANIVGSIENFMDNNIHEKDLEVKESCLRCNLLPICMTGCPRMKKEFTGISCNKSEIVKTIIDPIVYNL